MTDIALSDQIASVRREIALRERVYPKWIENGRMKQVVADRELGAMRAVLSTLTSLEIRATPKFWMNETSGVLRPAVEAYLNHRPMTPEHIAAMRAYLRQWIMADGWRGPKIAEFRARIDELTSRDALRHWLLDALAENIDPL